MVDYGRRLQARAAAAKIKQEPKTGTRAHTASYVKREEFKPLKPVKAQPLTLIQMAKVKGLEQINAALHADPRYREATIEDLFKMMKSCVLLEVSFFSELGGRYAELQDTTKEAEAEVARLQRRLAHLQQKMGKGGPNKIQEPKFPEPWFYEDILVEMHDLQDLVSDEHREKRRKYKALVAGAQKVIIQQEQARAKEHEEDLKARKLVCKSIAALALGFWQRIERVAWERLKQDLQAQLIEKKRQRLDKFVEDAIKLSITQNERFHRRKKRKATTTTSDNMSDPADVEREHADEYFESDADDDFVCSSEMKEMAEADAKLDEDLEHEERNIDYRGEVASLLADAEAPIEEVLQYYNELNKGFCVSAADSFHSDKEKDETEEEEEDDDGDESDFEVAHPRYEKQMQRDEILDEAMDEDSEGEIGTAIVNDLEAEANTPIEELLLRYNQQAQQQQQQQLEEESLSSTSTHSCPEKQSDDDECDGSASSCTSDSNLVQVPCLIRAILRPYQLEGLRWLASLYSKGTNGILADEMGLGKTLQTICLLAHLACEHNVWGPHLIVVPTSVLLNWEIEFKKFCPGFKVLSYYGNPAERAKKRVGWNKPHAFNVCIVSYATVVQDAFIMKRKSWVYMVLDEAQNIKNFNSKRWQTLLTFNTQGRILLTGTPLQNSLQELWSLMHFILPEIFTSHSEFKEWFSDPLTETIEKDQMAGESGALAAATSDLVNKLHTVFRPYLLRRLKKDVEKQMPSKYEHVLKCHLTRRQRVLYDELITSRNAQEALVNPSYRSMLNVLMQLRKICNHPDQLEVRQVDSPCILDTCTSNVALPRIFLLDRSTPKPDVFAIHPRVSCYTSNLARLPVDRGLGLSANVYGPCRNAYTGSLAKVQMRKFLPPGRTWNQMNLLNVDIVSKEAGAMIGRLSRGRDHGDPCTKHEARPNFDWANFDRETPNSAWKQFVQPTVDALVSDNWKLLQDFVCLVPRVQTRPQCYEAGIDGGVDKQILIGDLLHRRKYLFHVSENIEHASGLQDLLFPSQRMLHDDCGKFLVLGDLLKDLRARGSRCLVYTQFSKMLDILEKWINYQGFTYVRLDGSTKVDHRQRIVTRFNENERIFLFISSTRAGGVGLSLTGADSVIFYDTDWNPAMDRQAMDRCHRIGQTREVNVYRLICEHTVEENIWRKQLQKRRLDDIVVDRGNFDIEHHNWFSNVDTLVGILQECRRAARERNAPRGFGDCSSGTQQEEQEDIYGKRTLHESQAEIVQSSAAGKHVKLLDEVEDADDVVSAAKQKEKVTDHGDDFGLEVAFVTLPCMFLQKSTLTNVPALVAYSVAFICNYRTPTLITQVEEMKIRIQAEDVAKSEAAEMIDEDIDQSGDDGYDDDDVDVDEDEKENDD